MDRAKLTNPAEVLAFALSQVVKIGVNLVLGRFVLATLYGRLLHTGGAMFIAPISLGIGIILGLAAFPLFLALRMAFGGVPAVVAGSNRQSAFTTSGGEIGAYALAYVIELILWWLFNILVMSKIYVALQAAGRTTLVLPLTLMLTIALAAIFFLLFTGLRRAFSGSAVPAGRTPTVQR